MVTISIAAEAFAALKATLPLDRDADTRSDGRGLCRVTFSTSSKRCAVPAIATASGWRAGDRLTHVAAALGLRRADAGHPTPRTDRATGGHGGAAVLGHRKGPDLLRILYKLDDKYD
jgi:hypothetical protein